MAKMSVKQITGIKYTNPRGETPKNQGDGGQEKMSGPKSVSNGTNDNSDTASNTYDVKLPN